MIFDLRLLAPEEYVERSQNTAYQSDPLTSHLVCYDSVQGILFYGDGSVLIVVKQRLVILLLSFVPRRGKPHYTITVYRNNEL